ncbi:4-hydroxyphenylacetate decarboxylase activating enzyme [bacterium BMS3Abin05]|nr:4-hydroxyphenylacetate decarboxylase activating enzyme [bacterium BMS3Abin05]GBE26857.1 4-hydroxyphenylacetate decarboxylase activating enzyme [bacterium BMS3Bbin03]HDK36376.1 AmmeMemoRadiSam system radical SAM enzyme [Bacteroidota bacterium]HDZ10587.1 AmmeMemoRadiSam system radical SAM enzyme [Bacteroidota bacterium]
MYSSHDGKRLAMFWNPIGNKAVRCHLCQHRCRIPEGRMGVCSVRGNIDGRLYTFVYEKAVAVHVDPIEKKPLFHVFPGSRAFSVATVGCNFRCRFCQNWDISQLNTFRKSSHDVKPSDFPGEYLPANRIVELAVSYGCDSIAYTYTEPTVYYEYAYDTAKIAHENRILNLFITNGYITPEALEHISPYLDAANVDLKGFHPEFYKKKIGARLDRLLESLKAYKRLGIWLEVTTLVVPGYDDDPSNFYEIARFIRDELGPETPWHISRFFPNYKMKEVPSTDLKILKKARKIGLEEGLRYVYSGNVPGDEGENTYCYDCGKLLIRRFGFEVVENHLINGKCPRCSAPIDGIGMDHLQVGRSSYWLV